MKASQKHFPSLLAIALSAAFAPQALAAAGTAQFTAGDVQLKRADGGLARLSKGKDIESGQAIVTGADGRAQVRFTDGGLISLQPNTEFKIASYVDKLDAKEDRFLVDLLRGSMRAITGLIGKRNRDNYKVNTATATIGIRGSGFNVGYNPDGSLSVTTELDAIEVCTATGCVGLTAGESVRVLSNSQAPVRTNVRTVVPTPPPVQEALIATQQAGVLAQIKAPPVAIPAPEVILGNLVTNDIVIQTVSGSPFVGQFPTIPVNFGEVVTTTFSPTGQLLEIKNVQTSEIFAPAIPGTDSFSSGAPSDPNFVAWGSWTTASRFNSVSQVETPYDRFSYVAGRPSLNSLGVPATGVVGYSSLGGSIPVNTPLSVGVPTAGVFNFASLSVDFGQSSVGVSINTSIGTLTAGTGVLTANRTFTGSDGNSSTFTGFLIGPTGDRAGMSYNLLFGSGRTTGTIAFQANL